MNQSELGKLYSTKTNTELIKMYNSAHDYSKEAVVAINLEINKRGGLDLLNNEFEQLVEKENEKQKCYEFILHSLIEGKQKHEIRSEIQLKKINEEEFYSIYTECKQEYDDLEKNKKITAKSLLGGIFGGLIGSGIGGFVWGMIMVKTNRMFYAVGVALVLISYLLVWAFSGKDKRNSGTIIITIVSALIAFVIGQVIFEIYGTIE